MVKKPVGSSTIGELCVYLGIFLAIFATFAYIAREVTEGETLPRDQNILLFINSISSPAMDQSMLLVTTLGSPTAVVIAASVVAAAYLRARRWRAFTLILASIVGAGLLESVLKMVFARQRPELWGLLVHEPTYSFPSGHAAMSMALVAALVLIAWQTKWRWYVICGGTVFTLLVGFSRMYLGVHYPTDVLAGWVVAIGWVFVVATVLGATSWQRFSAK